MRISTSEWSVRMLTDFQHRMNTDAEYQRGKVWSEPQRVLLIDSILRGFAIPTIFLRKHDGGDEYLFDVVDGKQRLTAIWRFLSNDIRLLRNAEEYPGLGNLGGQCWSDLSRKAQDHLQFANITVSKIENASDDQIRELFLRLQKGEPLNAAEKRNAMSGPVRDFVAKKLAKHPLWPTTGISPKRFGTDEHSAILLALMYHRGPTAIKGADLQKLYEDDDFDPRGTAALQSIELLDDLYAVSRKDPRTIRTRWGLVDLSLVLMRARKDGIRIDASQVMNFYKEFEEERKKASVAWTDFQTRMTEMTIGEDTPSDAWGQHNIPEEILNYHRAFAREGGSAQNIDFRYKIMYKKFLDHLGRP